ncbi:hypothetical protein TIFTF001_006616 [Ficus carica]|uniref:Isochorismatase-like domain-containing protein n=1 Tax=Ficus carica TaxID=3494 RepID=A0AA87ZJB6_FICCA|nr:hypothetical protein TIFTF001_006616 [Ficus carica]
MAEKWNHTALLVIDMQKDFIDEDGLLRVNGGKAIVPNVIKAVQVARQRGIPVIWVVREHDPQGRDVELFRRHLYSDGKVGPTAKGSVGAELVEGLTVFDAVALDYQPVTVIVDATAAATTEIHAEEIKLITFSIKLKVYLVKWDCNSPVEFTFV